MMCSGGGSRHCVIGGSFDRAVGNHEIMTIQLTIAIPTYLREEILVETCKQVLTVLEPNRMELLVIDQTPVHELEVESWLSSHEKTGALRRARLLVPSLTGARNAALNESRGDVVMYLDDDVRVPPHLFRSHLRWYENDKIAAVTGEVYNCVDSALPPGLDNPDRGTNRHSGMDEPIKANNISGGNHSIRRKFALSIGGYDEQFVGSALSEDLDFSQRIMMAGGTIWYDPEAWIIHLGIKSGGCGVSGVRIWPEWTHSANLMMYAFRHGRRQKNFWHIVWMAMRNGPLRKENVRNPFRWPLAWWGFLRGSTYGWRHQALPNR